MFSRSQYDNQEVLVDSFGRRVTSLRISITNQCNLNCIYCHHEGDTSSKYEMSVDTISRIVHTASNYGVNKVKFSGGEPLMRDDFEEILQSLPPLKEVSATTNGVFLKNRAHDLKAAGLARVNISLDSLDPERYRCITNGKHGTLENVIDGIDASVDAGLTPVKLNTILLRGINDTKIDEMLEFIRGYNGDVILQLIELMDFEFGEYPQYRVNTQVIEKELESRADEIKVRSMHRRKKYIIDSAEIELVRPIDNTEFCANCNRLRVTADGKLKPCLLVNDNLVDVSGASAEGMDELLKLAVSRRIPYYRK